MATTLSCDIVQALRQHYPTAPLTVHAQIPRHSLSTAPDFSLLSTSPHSRAMLTITAGLSTQPASTGADGLPICNHGYHFEFVTVGICTSPATWAGVASVLTSVAYSAPALAGIFEHAGRALHYRAPLDISNTFLPEYAVHDATSTFVHVFLHNTGREVLMPCGAHIKLINVQLLYPDEGQYIESHGDTCEARFHIARRLSRCRRLGFTDIARESVINESKTRKK